ncbi:MAG TPA: ester cyclase [Miltoncostaeaceae bacterium]|nr:ester cyclase [Miltoncostaeaceae bacterium]
MAWLREAFADLSFDVEDVIWEGGKVVIRATVSGRHVGAAGPLPSFPVTNRGFSVQHIHTFRVVDGLIAEHWACRDDLGHLRQLGLLPGG